MITLANIGKTKPNAPRLLIYGSAGVGKTSLAFNAPNPIFLQTEKGEGMLQIDTFTTDGVFNDYDTFISAIDLLAQEDHPYRSVVIDSMDWLEPLVNKKTVDVYNARNPDKQASSLGDIPWGNGPDESIQHWARILLVTDYLSQKKGMNVIMIAHADAPKFKDPSGDAYNYWTSKLNPKANAKVHEHCDAIIHMGARTATRTLDDKRTVAVGGSNLVMRCKGTASTVAKNRYSMPEEIEYTDQNAWSLIAPYFPSAAAPVADEAVEQQQVTTTTEETDPDTSEVRV